MSQRQSNSPPIRVGIGAMQYRESMGREYLISQSAKLNQSNPHSIRIGIGVMQCIRVLDEY